MTPIKPNINTEIERISKFLAGEATPDEAIALENWLAEKKENLALYDECAQAWELSDTKNTYIPPDKEKAWKHINEIITERKESAFRSRIINQVRYKYAAMIAAILIITGALIVLAVDDPPKKELIKPVVSADKGLKIEKKLLADGSFVILARNSFLKPLNNFNVLHRKTQFSGEGFFSVAADPDKPFEITADNLNIRVLGTSFNLKMDAVTGITETQVTSGKVWIADSKTEIVIAAGQTCIYDKRSGRFSVINNIDANSLAYATHQFEFKETRLYTIINYLEKAYPVRIILRNPRLGNCILTGSFHGKSVEYIISVITTALNMRYTINDRVIYIDGNDEGC